MDCSKDGIGRMSFELSVVICTFNPKPQNFARCLEALRTQTAPAGAWELVVIDNRSDEPLEARTDLSWHPHARLVREETLGLTPARLRGIRESTGTLLVFVDDDNVLDPDYLSQVLRIGRERPYLGSWSGQCRGDFERPPPEWTRRYWGNLAVREFDEDVWSNLPRLAETMPCGAGLVVRRAVADHYLQLNESGQRGIQFDRTGSSLMSGGDNDLAACACDLGLGVGLCSSLKLQHIIPPDRLTADYLARLAEGISYSSILLDHQRGKPVHQRGLARRLADALRTLALRGPDRRIARAARRGADRAARQVGASRQTPGA